LGDVPKELQPGVIAAQLGANLLIAEAILA
jgi:hypothetical protein